MPKLRNKIGLPMTDEQIVGLVLRMAHDNPTWGYDRIVGELDKLGVTLSDTTVGSILRENATPPAPERKKGIRWAEFIAAHKDALVASDFFTKDVWTLLGPVTIYVLFLIHIASRKVHTADCIRHPNEAWMTQVARNVTMADSGFLDGRKYLILDRDTKFCQSFRQTLSAAGVEPLRLPARSSSLNAFAERFVRSVKEECLDRLILFGEASLRRAMEQYLEHDHHDRTHQGLGNVVLFPASEPAAHDGPVECGERLGGLLKSYHRTAA